MLKQSQFEHALTSTDVATHPFSPFRIPFTTSFTPRLTCRDLEAVVQRSVSRCKEMYIDRYQPFLIVLCSFFTSFFCARGCARGERSSGLITFSSFSFFAFLGDSCACNFQPRRARANHEPTYISIRHLHVLDDLLILFLVLAHYCACRSKIRRLRASEGVWKTASSGGRRPREKIWQLEIMIACGHTGGVAHGCSAAVALTIPLPFSPGLFYP